MTVRNVLSTRECCELGWQEAWDLPCHVQEERHAEGAICITQLRRHPSSDAYTFLPWEVIASRLIQLTSPRSSSAI